MKTLWILAAALAAPASAALTGSAESRRNLLNILPRKDARSVPTVADPADKLFAAENALSEGQAARAVFLYRLFVKECRDDASCLPYLDTARLGLGQSLAQIAGEGGQDASAAKESVYWLEAVRTPTMREEAEPERHRMRVLLANQNLLQAGADARGGAWNDAAARVENVGAEYSDTSADEGTRKYLTELRDIGRSNSNGARMADLAERLLSKPAEPAPARTRAAVSAPQAEKIPVLRAASAVATNGSVFDGAAHGKAPLSVSIEMLGDTPRELSVDYGNWNVAVGQIGVGGRSPLLEESPYLNIRNVKRSALNDSIDRRREYQVGVVQTNSRFFGDTNSYSADRLTELGQRLGIPPAILGQVTSKIAVDDPVKSELSVLAGSLFQFGRAIPVPLPFQSPVAADWAWSATMLAKTADYIPNIGANVTTGVDFTFPKGYQLGLFGGVTEDFKLISNSLIPDLARDITPKLGLGGESTPQVTVVAAGPVPGAPRVYVELGASQSRSNAVQTTKVQSGIYFDIYGKPVQLTLSHKDESGMSIDYSRRGAAAEVALTFAPGSSVYAACEKEKISFGGVDIANDGCMTGLRWTPGAAVTLTANVLFGGKDSIADPGTSAQAAALASHLAHLGATGLEVADRIAAKSNPWEGLNSAANAISRLTPDEAAAALDMLASSRLSPQSKELVAGLIAKAIAFNPDANAIRGLIEARLGPIPDVKKEYAARRTLATETISVLADPKFWDGAVENAIDAKIDDTRSSLKLSLGPLGFLRITNAQSILIGNSINTQGSPLSPITEQDATVLLQRLVLKNLAISVGASGADSLSIANAAIDRFRDALAGSIETNIISRLTPLLNDRAALANQVLASVPPEMAARLRAQFGNDLGLGSLDASRVEALLRSLPEQIAKDLRANAVPGAAKALDETVALVAHQVRLRTNRMLIQHMLAGEEFDRLTVDRGLKLGDHGMLMIGDSLKLLNERQRLAMRAHREEMIPAVQKRIDDHVRALTTAVGESLSAEMDALGSSTHLKIGFEAQNRAELVEAYGAEALKAAIGRIPKQAQVAISFDYDPHAPYITTEKQADGSVRVLLGPPGRNAEMALDTAIVEALKLSKR